MTRRPCCRRRRSRKWCAALPSPSRRIRPSCCDDSSYMSTRFAAAKSCGVGQLIVRHSMPTAYATSGRVWVEQ
eukprot:2167079-Pleurochrysis_carterae.AAC.1